MGQARRWLAWLAALAFSTRAFAFGPEPGSDEGPRTVVVLSVLGAASEVRSLSDSVKELLGRLGLSVTPTDAGEPTLATVSVALGDSECVVTVAKGHPGGRGAKGAVVELRRVPRQASTPVTLEAVAHVIQASVEQLAALPRAATQASVAPPPSPADAGAESASPPIAEAGPELEREPEPLDAAPGRGPSILVEALLSGASVASQVPIAAGGGLGASLWAPLSPRLAWGLRLGASYTGPGTVDQASVISTVHCASARLTFLLRYALSPRFELVGGVGGGADVLVTSNGSTSTELAPFVVPTTVEPSAVLGATVEADVRVAPWAQVFARLSGDLDLNPRTYVVNVGSTRTVLLQPWGLRPTLSLGVAFDVWRGR